MEGTVTRAVESDPHGYVDKLVIADNSTPVPLNLSAPEFGI